MPIENYESDVLVPLIHLISATVATKLAISTTQKNKNDNNSSTQRNIIPDEHVPCRFQRDVVSSNNNDGYKIFAELDNTRQLVRKRSLLMGSRKPNNRYVITQ